MTLRRREMLGMQRTDTAGDAGCPSKKAELVWNSENGSGAWKTVLCSAHLRNGRVLNQDGEAVIQE